MGSGSSEVSRGEEDESKPPLNSGGGDGNEPPKRPTAGGNEDALPEPDPDGEYLEVDPAITMEELEKLIVDFDEEVIAVYGEDGRLKFAPKIGLTTMSSLSRKNRI